MQPIELTEINEIGRKKMWTHENCVLGIKCEIFYSWGGCGTVLGIIKMAKIEIARRKKITDGPTKIDILWRVRTVSNRTKITKLTWSEMKEKWITKE